MVAQRQYEYGTSPRKIAPQNVPKKKTQIKTKSKKQIKANSKTIFLFKIKLFTLVAMFFLVIFGISYRYSLINKQFNEVRNLKKEYTAIEAENTQIAINIQNSLDLTKVERYAKDKLGMQKPEASQIEYLNLEKTDKIEVNENAVKENIFKNFFENVAKILD